MSKNQALKLAGSIFAAVTAVGETYKHVVSCEVQNSRWIFETVREIVLDVVTPDITDTVTVWVINNGDGSYRSVFLCKKEKNAMSVQIQFNPSLIDYADAEEVRKYAVKNAAVCEDLNNGMRFAFKSDRDGFFAGDGDESFDSYYSFIVLEDGTMIPTPVFFDACGLNYLDEVGVLKRDEEEVTFEGKTFHPIISHDVTAMEMVRYLRSKFREQCMGWVYLGFNGELVKQPITSANTPHTGYTIPHHYWGDMLVMDI